MTTVTLSEFNMNPARVRRLADKGDVVVLRRGVPAYLVSRIITIPENPLAALRSQGKLAAKRREHPRPDKAFPSVSTDIDLGAVLVADRGRLES